VLAGIASTATRRWSHSRPKVEAGYNVVRRKTNDGGRGPNARQIIRTNYFGSFARVEQLVVETNGAIRRCRIFGSRFRVVDGVLEMAKTQVSCPSRTTTVLWKTKVYVRKTTVFFVWYNIPICRQLYQCNAGQEPSARVRTLLARRRQRDAGQAAVGLSCTRCSLSGDGIRLYGVTEDRASPRDCCFARTAWSIGGPYGELMNPE